MDTTHYPGIHIAWRAFHDANLSRPHYPADDFKAGYRAGMDAARDDLPVIRAFVERVNARAEARMQAGNPLEGSHWLSMQAELKALEARASADAGDGRD